jgi:hypothetical protein
MSGFALGHRIHPRQTPDAGLVERHRAGRQRRFDPCRVDLDEGLIE